jgi:hypothetical protein
MATVGPRISTSITISNAGGTTNATTYDVTRVEKPLAENPLEDKVEDGQTIEHGFDTEVEYHCYDLAILTDARVQYGATIPSLKARIVENPVSGGVTVTIDNIRLRGVKDMVSQARPFAIIKGTKTSATSVIALS